MTPVNPLLKPTTHTFQVTLPTGFKVGLRLGRCPALSTFGHLKRSKKLARASVTIPIQQLAAIAILRHSGTPYSAILSRALAKEIACWDGWLDPRQDGFLRLAQHTTGHSGRLIECTSSLGEAIALYLAERMFLYPVSVFNRVRETDPLGMDFFASLPTGEVALEAKARRGWRYKTAKAEVREQFGKRTTATEKYGFILLYQQGAKVKKRRKSVVQLIDPVSRPSTANDAERLIGILRHYYDLCMSIGLWPAVTALGQRLSLPGPPIAMPTDVYARYRVDPSCYKSCDIRIGGRTYVGRFFDKPEADSSAPAESEPASWPNFFFGLDRTVFALLLQQPPDLLTRLETYARENLNGFAFSGTTEHGLARYGGLSNGVLRVDLIGMRQILEDNFDVPPVIPSEIFGSVPKAG